MGQARAKIAGSVPSSILNNLVEQAGGAGGGGGTGGGYGNHSGTGASGSGGVRLNNPVREDVRRDILRRMASLSQSGSIFEDGAKYEDSMKDAEDARLIVQGMDPACMEASRRGETFFERRDIPIERAHWIASMQGLFATAKYGCAYIHSDGSITMLQQGKDTACRCGSVHTGV